MSHPLEKLLIAAHDAGEALRALAMAPTTSQASEADRAAVAALLRDTAALWRERMKGLDALTHRRNAGQVAAALEAAIEWPDAARPSVDSGGAKA